MASSCHAAAKGDRWVAACVEMACCYPEGGEDEGREGRMGLSGRYREQGGWPLGGCAECSRLTRAMMGGCAGLEYEQGSDGRDASLTEECRNRPAILLMGRECLLTLLGSARSTPLLLFTCIPLM